MTRSLPLARADRRASATRRARGHCCAVEQRPARVLGVGAERTAGEQRYGSWQQLMLERTQRSEHLVWLACVRQLHGSLQNDGPGIHAGVDEVHGHTEDLDPIGERLLDRSE